MSDMILSDESGIYRTANRMIASLSETTRRQYQHTFNLWQDYCDYYEIPVVSMTPEFVLHFLDESGVSFGTKKTRLSHIRNLIKHLAAAYPDDTRVERMYRQIKLTKVIMPESEKLRPDTRNALTGEQIAEVFAIYPDESLLHHRNRAILASIFGTGIRRIELSRLQRKDIDIVNQLITIRHGKGNKTRTIPVVYHWQYIQDWYELTKTRSFFISGIRKGGHFAEDKPVNTQTIYRIVKYVGEALDIQHLSPHDARRTIITDLINKGVSIADVQYLAGHSHPETTLGYKITRDAIEVSSRIRAITEKAP